MKLKAPLSFLSPLISILAIALSIFALTHKPSTPAGNVDAGHRLGSLPTNGGSAVSPGTAGQVYVTTTGPATAWTSLINYDTTLGTLTAGNGGSNTFGALGPDTGSPTIYANLWLLNNGATRSNTNWVLQSDGTSVTSINAPSGSTVKMNVAGSIFGAVGVFSGSTGAFWLGNIGLSGTDAALKGDGTNVGLNTNPAGTTTILGSVAVTTRTITGALTIDTTTTDIVIIADTTSGAFNLTLPTPTNGRVLHVIDKTNHFGTAAVTLVRHAAEKIDNAAASKTLNTNGQRIDVYSDGTDWYTK